jgi:hypothetical protein
MDNTINRANYDIKRLSNRAEAGRAHQADARAVGGSEELCGVHGEGSRNSGALGADLSSSQQQEQTNAQMSN